MNFGIASYLKDLFLTKVKSSFYEELLNQVFQEEQMDIVLRYFNDNGGLVEAKYFDSAFLKQPNSSNNFHVKLLQSLSTID